MEKVKRKHAPTPAYSSPNQLTLEAFKSPFERELNSNSRWVVLAGLIPLDEISSLYFKNVPASNPGRLALNPRIVIGSLIIKHMCILDDREAVDQIAENIYMQYFRGYTSFIKEPPCDTSLFVDFRKKLGMDSLNAFNEKIAELKANFASQNDMRKSEKDSLDSSGSDNISNSSSNENKGRIIFDATACPQDIAYPKDLDLLSDTREKSERLIDKLFNPVLHEKKPRTYSNIVPTSYLKTSQEKNKTHKEIRKATGSQLRFLKRNLYSINRLLDSYKKPITALKQVLFFISIILFACENTCQAQWQKQKETTDLFGNKWQLVTSKIPGSISVRVVPLDKECKPFLMEKSNGFHAGKWNLIGSDINGFVWVGGESGLIRFDPRKPNEGWRQIGSNDSFPAGAIKSMSRSLNGLIQVRLKNGDTYELDVDKEGRLIAVTIDFKKESSKTCWKTMASMPYSNHDVFGAEYEKKIYMPGGQAPHGFPAVLTNFDRMMIYDNQKDSWSLTEPMSINRRYCNVGVLGSKIWVIGGYERQLKGEQATPTTEIYDPKTGTWKTGPSLVYPCAQAIVGGINDRLYVVYSDESRTKNYAFSISENEDHWQEETPPPYPVAQTDGCVFENRLYIMIPSIGLISYDPESKHWQTDYPPFPNTKAPRASAVANYKKQIWVISGTDVDDEKLVWLYSPDERKWTAGPKFPQSTLWADGLEVNGRLYVFGGAAYSQRHGIFVFRNNVYKLKMKLVKVPHPISNKRKKNEK